MHRPGNRTGLTALGQVASPYWLSPRLAVLRLREPRHRALPDPGDVPRGADHRRRPRAGRARRLQRAPAPARRAQRHPLHRDHREGPDHPAERARVELPAETKAELLRDLRGW